MNRLPLIARLLRPVAVLIAIAGLIDPVITTSRTHRPTVSVVTVSPVTDSARAERVAEAIANQTDVIRGPFAAADAVVIVGERPPDESIAMPTPVFAVVADSGKPRVTVERMSAPTTASRLARVPVRAVVSGSHLAGQSVEITLRANGLVVDRAERKATSDTASFDVTLFYPPAATGPVELTMSAALGGSAGVQSVSASASTAVDIVDRKWSLLFYDPHASWLATFMRRAAEEDDRFTVASRTITSRNISSDAGGPPATLEDPAALHQFDAIVVGGASALSEKESAGLDAFMRKRGGSVLLLLDEHDPGPWEHLVGATSWTDHTGALLSLPLVGEDSISLKSGEMFWPAKLPAGAEILASAVATTGGNGSHPVVWQLPVGAGHLYVSTTGDSWRFRDPGMSGFDQFWRSLMARASAATTSPIEVHLLPGVARPGQAVLATVRLQRAALQSRQGVSPIVADLSASLAIEGRTDSATTPADIYPEGSPGQFRGEVTAPMKPGIYRLTGISDGERGSAPLIVDSLASSPVESAPDLLASWIGSRGGKVLDETSLNRLPQEILDVVHPTRLPVPWHPMRSLWWLAVFAGVLSLEWWSLRRGGGA